MNRKKTIYSIIFGTPVLGTLAWIGFFRDLQPNPAKTEYSDKEINITNSTSPIITDNGPVTQNNYYSNGDGEVKGEETKSGSPIFYSDFLDDKWTSEKGIRFENQQISLYWGVKNGYLLTKEKFSERFTVSVNFIPLTQSINFSFVLEDAFKIVFGDGDNQEVILKKFDTTDPNWTLVKPNNETSEERPNRIRLKNPISIDKEVNLQLAIDAKSENDNNITVSVSAKFFSSDGNIVEIDKPLVWDFSIDGRLNRERRLGVGLVDELPWARPKTKLIEFRVYNQ